MTIPHEFLDPWQKEILDCKDKFILLAKGRQIGGTFTMARKCALRMISQPNCQIVIVSLTEDQAELVIVMMRDFLESEHKKLISKKKFHNTKKLITLKNGARAISRPVGTTGNSIRGFTGGVLYLNEVSRMDPMILEAAKPILLTTSGEIWMDSTHFGTKGYFYKCYLNKNKRWRVFYHSSEEVINNRKISRYWTEQQREDAIKFLKEEEEEMTRLQYAQEYLGLAMEELKRFYKDDWIEKVCDIKEHPKEIKQNRDYFLGVDIARMGADISTFESFDGTDKKNIFQVAHETTSKTKLTETEDKIIQIGRNKNYHRNSIGIDDAGLGAGVFDNLMRNDEVKRKIVGLSNARREVDREGKKKKLMKDVMHFHLKMLGERGRIKLFNDEEIKSAFKSVQFDEEAQKILGGKEDHIVEGVMRATWCIKNKPHNLWIK